MIDCIAVEVGDTVRSKAYSGVVKKVSDMLCFSVIPPMYFADVTHINSIPVVYYKDNIYKKVSCGNSIRSHNEGLSDYSKHEIQPWDIWKVYHLNPWDADIVKRTLRTKQEGTMTSEQARILDYKKIIHVCQERISHLESGYKF